MRLLAAAALVLVTALGVGASLAPAADIGANDDSAKYAQDGGAAMYEQMRALGLRQVVIGVRFVPSDPMVIQDKAHLDAAVETAAAAGLRVVLAVYPYPPRELEAGLGAPTLFAGYVGALASIYPDVRQLVIGNEPNQPAFWRPQFDAGGANVSAKAFGPYLAAAYDALKGVDETLRVVGVGLSPRGNDRPDAKNNISTSPVRFLRALGDWYRRSGRTRPLMDAFSFHPYPRQATDPLDRGYSWPNVGFADLDRLKQALWDAFHGTAQPTTVEGLKLHLDEVGWQVDTARRPGYLGRENVPVTDEITQAGIYGDLVRRAACDTDLAEVSFFGFRDDTARAGFQAGLLRADGTARVSADAVREAISAGEAGCTGALVRWRPGQGVLDARVAVAAGKPSQVATRIATGEDARAVVCVTSRASVSARCRAAVVVGLRPRSLQVPAPAGARGRVQVSVRLAAESNRSRKTVVVARTALGR
ncbi:MAG TPA: hypothetical protein VFB57_00330 [Gaiellaceae bacterium]|jgi:hypothetical protein|nr:hypothetical protein [Gaiellaceae bacterium]